MAQKLTANDLRARFLKYFEARGHRGVPSSSLVPKLDPTLLFTNAGMNQFKALFTGEEKPDGRRAASSQKCVRAGGKHNDLENVGRTARHHTFFEMLGNFSFGDYFKREAIDFAWEFVTKELRIDPKRLYVSVFRDDDDAFALWRDHIGVKEERIFRFGEKDNFWAMGDTGPCGPCSEIYFDQGEGVGCGRPECTVGCDCDRYLEFWNLVFMEFEQRSDGSRSKLPKPSIDTGMGLERITAIVQGVRSNYDTDLFAGLLAEIGKMCKRTYATADEASRVSMRVVADHIRATTFLITDGVRPSNEGRGYVLRRIIRRAARHGRSLGLVELFFHRLSETVVREMGDAYPELRRNAALTSDVIVEEEKRFAATLDRGLALFATEIEKLEQLKEKVLPGDIAFRLYDTYGFPVDLTADLLRERGLTYDHAGFEEAFARHREKARGSWKESSAEWVAHLASWTSEGIRSDFLGYSELAATGKMIALLRGGKRVEVAEAGEEVSLVADRTPFYGESGGQVGDIGGISGEGFSLEVLDTKKPTPTILLHRCRVTEGRIALGQEALFSVNAVARSATAKNHTATHMMHATLKEVLGVHVKQEGSLVSPERLRFDFSHPAALTTEQMAAIEKKINERIWLDTRLRKDELPLDQALRSGAVALFDEKYGDRVRVVSIGEYSKELCGGTHLERTGEIGLFKIVKESSVAAGVRRLEAFTGYRALYWMQEQDRQIREMAALLGSSPDELNERVTKLLQKQKEMEKGAKKQRAAREPSSGEGVSEDVNGICLVWVETVVDDQRELRELADRQMEKIRTGVVGIGATKDEKAFVVVKVSKDLTPRIDAGRLIQPVAQVLEGSGGGRSEMAQAGGSAVHRLGEVRATLRQGLLNLR